MTRRWAIKWHVGFMWNGATPHLFITRREAREYIEKDYGYIKTRPDLRNAPHYWRLPKAVKVEIMLKER